MSELALANLVHEQQQLLRVLLGDRDRSGLMSQLRMRNAAESALAGRGLLAYQSHGLALAERALSAAYPVIGQLLGADNFTPLARQFWRQHPPAQGDMAGWGGKLPAFIEAELQLAGEPFLGDVARVEWALHQAATAADSSPDLPSIALLASHEPEAITLRLCSGAVLVTSAYPVVSLVKAHLAGGEPDLTRAGELLRGGIGEHALVWRQGFKPQVEAIGEAEAAFVRALLQGQSLAQALDAAAALPEADAFDFNDWLTRAAQTSLLAGAQLL